MNRRNVHRPLALALAALAFTAAAATPGPAPRAQSSAPRTMANVYLLAHAGAILDICLASPARETLAAERATELSSLAARLGRLVDAMASHQRDTSLPAVYEATKASMAADTKLRFHTKNNHRNCGDRFVGEMQAYVAENEAVINQFIERSRAAAKAPVPPAKPAPAKP